MAEVRLNSPNVTTFTVSVGDIVKISRPVGYPPFANMSVAISNDGSDSESLKTEYELYGFKILDKTLGKFVKLADTNLIDGFVYYNHTKSGRQIVRYKSKTIIDTLFYIVVQGVQIHDHASIYQGGPAFATYWAETSNRQEE